ncbi:MAG: HhoA/HhoB/HtrA family serine endopeptidase [Cyanobacteriota bacterium]
MKPAFYLLLPLVGTGVMLLGGCSEVSNLTRQQTNPQGLEESNRRSSSNRSLVPTEEDRNFVVDVVNKVESAVVRINTSQTVRTEIPEAFNDPFLRRFFGDGLPSQPQERVQRGVGSGFVIDSKGLILTNSHVVNRADTVTVSFPDGRSFEGKVLGEDPLTDIAVVQVPENNLPTIELASAEKVQRGQWAIAIGNPLGLEETVTVGVVSAIDRSSSDIGAADKRVGFIQTDAAINPGNSGGPLLNARGQVIGVNTAIIKGAQGIGFAIPIDTAMRIAEQLITKGKVEHPFLGIEMIPLTPEIKQRLNNIPNSNVRVEADKGILIVRVVQGSPADEAGLRQGDVIQAINNQPVTKAEQVQQQVEKSGVGSQLPITVQRGEQTLQVTVQPAPLPERPIR